MAACRADLSATARHRLTDNVGEVLCPDGWPSSGAAARPEQGTGITARLEHLQAALSRCPSLPKPRAHSPEPRRGHDPSLPHHPPPPAPPPPPPHPAQTPP